MPKKEALKLNKTQDEIIFALSKGRLMEPTLELLRKAQVCEDIKLNPCQLVSFDTTKKIGLILIKAQDVPFYIEHGIADCGVVGADIVYESGADVYVPLQLNFGHCRLVVAGKANQSLAQLLQKPSITVATKYPRLTYEYFRAHENVKIIKLEGSVEVACALGLSDMIVDIVETGRTLAEHGLRELVLVCESWAKLIVNRASLKIKFDKLKPILEKISAISQT